MTTPITKEQLRAYAEKKVNSLRFAIKQSAFTGITEGLEKDLHLAEFALAAMDAEPVAWVCSHGDEIEYNGHNQFSGGRQGLPLYAAPPAPICSRPVHPEISSEELDDETLGELIDFRRSTLEYHSQQGNKVQTIIHGVTLTALLELRERRAAMLQGADGALICEGTRQTDELVMWIKRLAHSLKKANPDSKLQSDAMEYLSRKGLIRVEDVLR